MTASTRHRKGRYQISVVVADKAWKTAGKNVVRAVKTAVDRALSRADTSEPLTILLTGDAHIRALNWRHRKKDKATNVLSFQSSIPGYLGDIAIAYGVSAREAAAAGKRLSDHLAHLAVHGTLHLLGYDHIRAKDADCMEALETEILAELGVPDPYQRNAA
ncbi:MAG: rRNA maturation RNase YbeY [Alphaproteobacteria bacterium]|nr:rRNA maturation RNase YbeY [Alphaproteobacteria bacterium]MBV9061938.1 rRNA maturation RNase YbeY [Alphaproteobacteria bacterium]